MLQRAASNAYSWWWASHIRTKQSKWLEQNLQDMEEKVAYTLKLIEEDGDSFAKRAEMYYKKRPELINFVEEAYRAYRALAERYDHISTELQNANTTIAAVFPEQVQFAIDDDDEDALPKTLKKPTQVQKQNIPNVPKAPINKDLKSIISTATRKLQPSKSTKKAAAVTIVKSGLTKSEGLKEIDNLQKRILALQTEKEFVKSSYESRLAKYWEIESQIKELQERVGRLHDEFGEGIVIEDEEARRLMTSAALKSCQETLAQLQEKQERSAEDAKVEYKKIKDVREKFESLKDGFHGNEISQKKPSVEDDPMKPVDELEKLDQEVGSATQDREEAELSQENIKEELEVASAASLTVTEMAEKIDEIVNKVVSLETAFSAQTSLVHRLRIETDELQTQIKTLEVEKMMLFNNKTDLSNKLMETEEKLHRLQGLNCNVEDYNSNIQAPYTEARNLDYLSDKPQSQNSDRELEFSSQKEKYSVKVELQEEIDGQKVGVELREEIDEQEDGVKLQEEIDGKDNGVKLQEIDEQEDGVNTNDDLKQPEKVTLSEKLELEQEKTTQNKESIAQVRLQKEIDGQEVTMISNDDLKRLQSTELTEQLGDKTSSEKQNTSLVKGQYHKEFEGFECAPNLDTDKQHSEKPDEEPKVTGLAQKQEISMVPVWSLEEFKEQEEKPNYSDATKMVRDVETKAAEDIKQHDRLTMPGIQGEVLSQLQAKDELGNLLEQRQHQMTLDQVNNQTSLQAPDNFLDVGRQEETIKQGDEPDWKQMFLNGIENREKVLLKEYTTVLRNYKELKKKHDEGDMKSGQNISQITVQLQELRNANATKDEKIRLLLEQLRNLQAGMDENNNLHDQSAKQKVTVIETSRALPPEKEVEILLVPVDQPQITSEVEENFRMRIDELLEENLDFWLRFSTSFHEIQKFETEVKDLQAEVSKLQEKQKKNEGSNSIKYSLKSDVRPLYKHLREIQTELTVWMEKCALLKEELTSRFSSLCNIQEEITGALKTSAEDDDFKFTSYQAAKFQGEVLNMKQENNKVADELQAGLDYVTSLQIDIEKTLTLLREEFGLSQSKHDPNMELVHSDSKTRVPLRSFIFGIKQKKQRPSLLSCMHPALAKKYNDLRSGLNR